MTPGLPPGVHRETVGLVFVFLGAALFGTLGVFGEAATLVGLSTATLLGVRFVAATAVLWGYLAWRGRLRVLRSRLLGLELGLGVVYGVMSLAYFESLAWLSAGVAALLLFTYPVQVTVVSAVALDEPVTVPKLLSLAAALCGVALVVSGGRVEAGLAGVVLVGVASLAYTTYSTATRAVVADVDPLVHAAYVFVGVTGTVIAYGALTGTLGLPGTMEGWTLTAGITVVGTLLPMVLFTEGLVRVPASRASVVSTSEPLTTVGLGVVLLGEPLTPAVAGGAVLVLSGVALASPAVERVTRRRLQRPGSHPTDR